MEKSIHHKSATLGCINQLDKQSGVLVSLMERAEFLKFGSNQMMPAVCWSNG